MSDLKRISPEVGGAAFRDHFSGASSSYATFRPTYPSALYEKLAEIATARRLAWDCGTGTGQAAIGLAAHFDWVIATDPSSAQIAAATPRDNIEYRIALAEQSGLPAHSIDLITVAQALHWFDLDRFYSEVRRVLAPHGVLAVWCYGDVHIAPEIDRVIGRFYNEEVGPYWPPERVLVDDRYASLPFPFPEIELPEFSIERQLVLGEFAGYLRTWSATQRYIADRGADPVVAIEQELAPLWGATDARRRAVWPLFIRAGRV